VLGEEGERRALARPRHRTVRRIPAVAGPGAHLGAADERGHVPHVEPPHPDRLGMQLRQILGVLAARTVPRARRPRGELGDDAP
jgi:hypothetical protein